MSKRIACSPLTGRIYQGRISRDGTCFVGRKLDITSDVLCAVVEKAEYHGGSFTIEAGSKTWSVTVTLSSAEEGGAA